MQINNRSSTMHLQSFNRRASLRAIGTKLRSSLTSSLMSSLTSLGKKNHIEPYDPRNKPLPPYPCPPRPPRPHEEDLWDMLGIQPSEVERFFFLNTSHLDNVRMEEKPARKEYGIEKPKRAVSVIEKRRPNVSSMESCGRNTPRRASSLKDIRPLAREDATEGKILTSYQLHGGWSTPRRRLDREFAAVYDKELKQRVERAYEEHGTCHVR